MHVDQDLVEKEIEPIKQSVYRAMTTHYVLIYTGAILIFTASIMYVFSLVADLITVPIDELYQRIKLICDHYESNAAVSDQATTRKRNLNVIFNWKESNREFNHLYFGISKLIKAINFAGQQLQLGDDNLALFNYHEVQQIYGDLGNKLKQGSCLNNIGCLYLKTTSFNNAAAFLLESINTLEV